MTIKECCDWVKALGECLPRRRTRRLKKLLTRFGLREELGRWEIGVEGSGSFSAIGLRYFGTGDESRSLQRDAGRLLGQDPGEGLTAPPAGFPWLSFNWDLKRDALEESCLYSSSAAFKLRAGQAAGLESHGERVMFHPMPLSPRALEDAELSAVFADVAVLFPVKDIVTRWVIDGGSGRRKASGRWALRFKEGVPWTRFIASNLADPFITNSSRLAYLLLNRRVSELSFEKKSLCAHIGA